MRTLLSESIVKPGLRTPLKEGDDLIRECYEQSARLLKENSRPFGVIASKQTKRAEKRHYSSIFGRDASICSLGMAASQDEELLRSAKESLLTLAGKQTPQGQIPNYVKPERGDVDFWYLGCIDATLWWLIALNHYDRFAPGENLAGRLAVETGKAISWLSSQEHQGLFLLQQNEASDWADIMPRSGFVLYSNALWYYVKSIYELNTALETKKFCNHLFYPFGNEVPTCRRTRVLRHYIRNNEKCRDYYLSFVNLSFWGAEGDVFGNIMGLLAGLADTSKASRIVDALLKKGLNMPFPVRVVASPIKRDDTVWRQYMGRHKQNLPYQYHNGGIWPFVGCFWSIMLAKLGKKEMAWKELRRLAEVNSLNDWEFNEWYHGKTGKPMGMAGQSWNAAMFILAYHALSGDVSFMS
jgi:glycogen debranching enzyme